MTRLATLLTALLLCSCSTGSGAVTRTSYAFERDPQAASGWLQLVTPDFVLRTDLNPEQAEHAAQLLSQSLAGLRAMFGKAPTVGRLELTVYAMKDDLEFERRFGKLTWGFASVNGDESTIFLYGAPDRWFVRSEINYEGTQSVLQHELAHVILRQYFHEQPQWFAEGLAQYLETFRWIDAETIRFGDPNLTAYRNYRAIRSLNISQLRSWSTIGQRELEVYGMYGLSWALVHFAINTHPREFGKYMELLAREGPDEAWRQTFARLPDLDQAVYGYMKVGAYQPRLVKVPAAVPVPATVRLMTPAQLSNLETVMNEMQRTMRKHNGS